MIPPSNTSHSSHLDTVTYIGALVHELSTLAYKVDQPMLVYFLKMAEEEAMTIAAKSGSKADNSSR